MKPLDREMMTAAETARWFRRSRSWLRRRPDILKLAGACGRPLYHVNACRAYLLGLACNLDAEELRRVQLDAIAAASGLAPAPKITARNNDQSAAAAIASASESCSS